MSVNLYQTGVSGLLAAQQQLATTGHNIANVNTEGYNRQRVEQETAIASPQGSNFLGGGTYVQDVTRIYDQFAYKEQLLAKGNLSQANASHDALNQLNEIMSFSGERLSGSLDLFYQTVNGIADNPSDLGLRNIALTQAEILAGDFRSLDQNFEQLESSINDEITQVTAQISEISLEIAKINEQVLQSNGFSNQGQANDLLDRRDGLITELGNYAKVSTLTDANGVMTVMVGNGTTLVAGITPLTLQVKGGDPDPAQSTIELVGPNSAIAIDERFIGGSLGAKLAFRNEDLMQARSEINRISMGIAQSINELQADGIDLNEQQGTDLFTDINNSTLTSGRVFNLSDNAGNLSADVVITDISLVPTNEFEIEYNGTDYIMTDTKDGSSYTLVDSGGGVFVPPAPTDFGFSFNATSGGPAAGDKFVIRPTENAAALMEVQITDGASIAASAAIEIQPSDNNISAGQIEIVNMYDPEGARTAAPMRIDVLENPAGTWNYTYTDNAGVTSAPVAYTPPSQVIDLPPAPSPALFQIEIKGTPSGIANSAPEQFFINDAFGSGNSSNAVKMARTQEQGLINNGRESFTESLGITTSSVGSKAKSAELIAETSEALHTQAYNRVQATSGVNLDEEAANLLQFQQAYQAASQIVSSANTIFDALLAIVR